MSTLTYVQQCQTNISNYLASLICFHTFKYSELYCFRCQQINERNDGSGVKPSR